ETYLAIKALGAKQGSSLFATLFAGYGALLAKLSGRSDIVIGVPLAGQQLVDDGNLVGHCVNFLPLRLDVDTTKPFADLLSAAKSEVLDAYDH
ncbi:condensation domain-containing protein, partial [Staphylococcus aureus]